MSYIICSIYIYVVTIRCASVCCLVFLLSLKRLLVPAILTPLLRCRVARIVCCQMRSQLNHLSNSGQETLIVCNNYNAIRLVYKYTYTKLYTCAIKNLMKFISFFREIAIFPPKHLGFLFLFFRRRTRLFFY